MNDKEIPYQERSIALENILKDFLYELYLTKTLPQRAKIDPLYEKYRTKILEWGTKYGKNE